MFKNGCFNLATRGLMKNSNGQNKFEFKNLCIFNFNGHKKFKFLHVQNQNKRISNISSILSPEEKFNYSKNAVLLRSFRS